MLSFVLAFFEDGEEGMQAFVEPFVILLILIINAIVGVWQEHSAENALEALKELQNCSAQAIRGGELVPDVPAADLVPGDIVIINVGDKVPADVRVIKLKTTSVRTDEGALTGESETVMKQLEPVGADSRIQDKKNMMFRCVPPTSYLPPLACHVSLSLPRVTHTASSHSHCHVSLSLPRCSAAPPWPTARRWGSSSPLA